MRVAARRTCGSTPRLLDGRGHGDRLRRGRLAACAGPVRRGHRVVRLVLGFLRAIKDRGARGVQLVTSDANKGPAGAIGGGLPGRLLAEMRRPPDARLHARGGVAPAQEAGRPHALAGVSRQGRRDGAGHVPRGPRHAARLLPQGRRRGRGGRARRARLPGISAVALEAAAREQRAGAGQPHPAWFPGCHWSRRPCSCLPFVS